MENTAYININSTSGTAVFNTWNAPERVSVKEVGDTIEMTYTEISMMYLAVHPPRPPERRVFKVVYSCKDGKWDKSDRIYGKIVAPTNEYYIFESE